MRIDIIDSYETLLRLKANWDHVYDQDPEANFFLSWTWLSEWLRDDTSQWYVLAAALDSESTYVAFFPLRLRTRMRPSGGFYNIIGLAGRGLSDYTGVITIPAFEAEAIDAFSRYLKKSSWSVLSLEFVRTTPSRLQRLLRHFPPKSFGMTETQTMNARDSIDNSICPLVELPDSWDDYLATLGSNTRRNLRRFLRKVEEDDEFRITTANADTIDADLDHMLRLWSVKWTGRKGDRVPRLVRANRRMFKTCFAHDALFVPILWQGERPLAALATFIDHKKRTLLCFMTARDETFQGMPSPAIVLHAYSVRHAIANGFRTYDFTRGNEDYKYCFGVHEVILTNLAIGRRSQKPGAEKLDARCIPKVLGKTMELHSNGKIEAAVLGYRQVLAVSPQSPAALYGYGQLLAKQGAHREAARLFRKLVALQPDAYKAWLRLGAALEATQRFAEAADIYRNLIQRDPNDKKVRIRLGRMLLALGKREEAYFMLEAAGAPQRPNALRLN